MPFLRLIIIGLIILFIYRLIKSVMFPRNQFPYGNTHENQRKKEGETTILKKKTKNQQKPDDKGEYIDYEEIE